MKWDEFNSLDQHKIPTSILCPKCGKNIFMSGSTVILTWLPPKYCYQCECGWTGYSYSMDLSAFYNLEN